MKDIQTMIAEEIEKIGVGSPGHSGTAPVLGNGIRSGARLDFVLLLIFIVLALPTIKDRTTGAAALFAGVAAVLATALPLNLCLIGAALIGVLGGLIAESLAERSEK